MLEIVLETTVMNPLLFDILEDLKHKHNFPPRDLVLGIKESHNASGVLNSSMTATEITKVYIESASAGRERPAESPKG